MKVVIYKGIEAEIDDQTPKLEEFEGEEGSEKGIISSSNNNHLARREGVLWKDQQLEILYVLSIHNIAHGLAANNWVIINGAEKRYLREKVYPDISEEEIIRREMERLAAYGRKQGGLDNGAWDWDKVLRKIFDYV